MRPRGNHISRGSVLFALAVAIAALGFYIYSLRPKYDIPDYSDVPVNVLSPYGDGKPDEKVGASGSKANIMSQMPKEDIGQQVSPQKAALNNKLTNELRQVLDY